MADENSTLVFEMENRITDFFHAAVQIIFDAERQVVFEREEVQVVFMEAK